MILPEAAKRVIRDFPLGFVATITPGGRPAVSPKGTFVVLDDRTIAFGEIRSPQTLSNLGHHPECEVNFVDAFTRKGARIRGTTRVLRRGTADFDARIGIWADIWGDLAARINALVLIDVEEVKLLSTPPYDDGATEDDMIALYKSKYAALYP